ncbi:MAG: CHAT domain-containing protein, partial [Caldilineae bacterium]|nr:CHAT domain-containing protein [Caldilineae bacterium]
DITCPRRVWVIYGRIAVTVGLTVDPSQYSAAVEELRLRESQLVQVRIAAPGFEVLSAPEQQIAIRPGADSLPVVFYLHPQEVGHWTVSFDFSQAGSPLGTAAVTVEITDYEVEAVPESRTGSTLHTDPAVAPPDRMLYVRFERTAGQSQLVFTLQRAGEVGSEFQPVPIPGDPEQFAEELFGVPETLRRHARKAVLTPDEADRQLRAIGRNLWNTAIPQDLRELYAAEREAWRNSTLMVVSDEPYIPWELVWPYGEPGNPWQDDDPWCVTLHLTRWLRRTAQGRGNPGPPGRLSLNALARLVPTDSGLPQAIRERDMLRGLVSARGLRDLGPDEPTWSAAMDLLEEGGYDWLHIAGHGQFYDGPADSASVIRLQEKRELMPQHLAGPEIETHIYRQRPGFFFNVCHGGRQGWALTHLGGWAETLISDGAGLFISPQWEVTDKQALDFATTFYGQLLAGRTVAEAVQAARLAVRTPGNPAWLAYSVYAHPNARLENTRQG